MRHVNKILINNPKDVEKVWSIFNKYKEDIDVSSGRYTIDGKSVMGLMMFIGTPVDVDLPGYPSDTVLDLLREDLHPWIYEKRGTKS